MIIIDHFTRRIRDGSLSMSHEGLGSDFWLGRDLTRTVSSGAHGHSVLLLQGSVIDMVLRLWAVTPHFAHVLAVRLKP